MKLSLCNLEYKEVNDKPVLYLFCRDQEGKRHVLTVDSFIPYFYVPEDIYLHNYRPSSRLVTGVKGTRFRSWDRKKLVRIESKVPNDVKTLRGYFEKRELDTLEADIVFPLRFMIDKKIYNGIELDEKTKKIIPANCPSNLKVVYLDIEIFAKEVPDTDNAVYEVNVIGLFDAHNQEYIILHTGKKIDEDLSDVLKSDPKKVTLKYFHNETHLFVGLVEEFERIEPDVVFTFSPFDFTYLFPRMRFRGVSPELLSPKIRDISYRREGPWIKGISLLDIQMLNQEVEGTTVQWQTLDFVSNKVLGYGQIPVKDFRKTWTENPTRLLRRNIRDCELIKEIDRVRKLLFYFDQIRLQIGCRLEDTLKLNRIADVCYLRFCRDHDIALPTKSSYEHIHYPGAKVFECKAGIHKNVAVLDWKRMYPSIIKGFNISFETFNPLRGDIVIDESHKFISSRKGITVMIIDQLLPLQFEAERLMDEAKKRSDKEAVKAFKTQRQATKRIIHPIYGMFGYSGNRRKKIPAFRLYNPHIAESITIVCYILIDETGKVAMEIGENLIYGDTDSVFIGDCTRKKAEHLTKILTKKLIDSLQKRWVNAKIDDFTLDVDKIYTHLILITKKRYYGETDEGDTVIRGLEIIRASASALTKKIQKEIIKLSFQGKKEEIRTLMRTTISDLCSGKIESREFSLPRKVSKRAYKVYGEPIKAFFYSNSNLEAGLKIGERFYMVHVKKVPSKYPQTIEVLRKRKGVRVSIQERVKVIGFRETIPEGFEVDFNKMKELTLKNPCEDILKLNGIEWDEVDQEISDPMGRRPIQKTRQQTLSLS